MDDDEFDGMISFKKKGKASKIPKKAPIQIDEGMTDMNVINQSTVEHINKLVQTIPIESTITLDQSESHAFKNKISTNSNTNITSAIVSNVISDMSDTFDASSTYKDVSSVTQATQSTVISLPKPKKKKKKAMLSFANESDGDADDDTNITDDTVSSQFKRFDQHMLNVPTTTTTTQSPFDRVKLHLAQSAQEEASRQEHLDLRNRSRLYQQQQQQQKIPTKYIHQIETNKQTNIETGTETARNIETGSLDDLYGISEAQTLDTFDIFAATLSAGADNTNIDDSTITTTTVVPSEITISAFNLSENVLDSLHQLDATASSEITMLDADMSSYDRIKRGISARKSEKGGKDDNNLSSETNRKQKPLSGFQESSLYDEYDGMLSDGDYISDSPTSSDNERVHTPHGKHGDDSDIDLSSQHLQAKEYAAQIRDRTHFHKVGGSSAVASSSGEDKYNILMNSMTKQTQESNNEKKEKKDKKEKKEKREKERERERERKSKLDRREKDREREEKYSTVTQHGGVVDLTDSMDYSYDKNNINITSNRKTKRNTDFTSTFPSIGSTIEYISSDFDTKDDFIAFQKYKEYLNQTKARVGISTTATVTASTTFASSNSIARQPPPQTIKQSKMARFDPFYKQQTQEENIDMAESQTSQIQSEMMKKIELLLELHTSTTTTALHGGHLPGESSQTNQISNDIREIEYMIQSMSVQSEKTEQEWLLYQQLQDLITTTISCFQDQISLLSRFELVSTTIRKTRYKLWSQTRKKMKKVEFFKLFGVDMLQATDSDYSDVEENEDNLRDNDHIPSVVLNFTDIDVKKPGIPKIDQFGLYIAEDSDKDRVIDDFGRDITRIVLEKRRKELEMRRNVTKTNFSSLKCQYFIQKMRKIITQLTAGNSSDNPSEIANSTPIISQMRQNMPLWFVSCLESDGYASDNDETIDSAYLITDAAAAATLEDRHCKVKTITELQNQNQNQQNRHYQLYSDFAPLPILSNDFSFTKGLFASPPLSEISLSLTEKLDLVLFSSRYLFSNADDDIQSPKHLLEILSTWKKSYYPAYKTSTITNSLIQLLAPYVRVEILDWNPFSTQNQANYLQKMKWYSLVLQYMMDTGEIAKRYLKYSYAGQMNHSDAEHVDPDYWLLPQLIIDHVIPYLMTLIQTVFRPGNTSTGSGLFGMLEFGMSELEYKNGMSDADDSINSSSKSYDYNSETSFLQSLENIIFHLHESNDRGLILDSDAAYSHNNNKITDKTTTIPHHNHTHTHNALNTISASSVLVREKGIERLIEALRDKFEDSSFALYDQMPLRMPYITLLRRACVPQSLQPSQPTHQLPNIVRRKQMTLIRLLSQANYVGTLTFQALKLIQTLVKFRYLLAVSDTGLEDERRQVTKGKPLPIHSHATCQKYVWFLFRKIIIPTLVLYLDILYQIQTQKDGSSTSSTSSVSSASVTNLVEDENDENTMALVASMKAQVYEFQTQMKHMVQDKLPPNDEAEFYILLMQAQFHPDTTPYLTYTNIIKTLKNTMDNTNTSSNIFTTTPHIQAITMQWVTTVMRIISMILPPDWTTIGTNVPRAGTPGLGGKAGDAKNGTVHKSFMTDLAMRAKLFTSTFYDKPDPKRHHPIVVTPDSFFLFSTLRSTLKSWLKEGI